MEKEHYRVNIGHSSPECFHHFDDATRMFAWISERIGKKVNSFEDCDRWTQSQEGKRFIEILYISDIKRFYQRRREYVICLRNTTDCYEKAQRSQKSRRRDYFIRLAGKYYEDANWYWDADPEVWQGEI